MPPGLPPTPSPLPSPATPSGSPTGAPTSGPPPLLTPAQLAALAAAARAATAPTIPPLFGSPTAGRAPTAAPGATAGAAELADAADGLKEAARAIEEAEDSPPAGGPTPPDLPATHQTAKVHGGGLDDAADDLKEAARAIKDAEDRRKVEEARKITDDPAAMARMEAGLATGDKDAMEQAKTIQAGAAAQARLDAEEEAKRKKAAQARKADEEAKAQAKKDRDAAVTRPIQAATQIMNNPIGGALAMLPGPIGALGQAAQAAVGALGRIVTVSMQYAGALNPSLVKLFDSALRDLHATIGQALTPVVSGATYAIRLIGSTINLAMQQMRPVVQQLVSMFNVLLDEGLQQFGMMLEAVKPLISAFMAIQEVMQPIRQAFQNFQGLILSGVATSLRTVAMMLEMVMSLSPPLQAVKAAFEALAVVLKVGQVLLGGAQEIIAVGITMLRAAMGDLLGDLPFKNVKQAMLEFGKVVLVAAAHLAKFYGGEAFIKGMRRSLGGDRLPIDGMAAGQNPQYSEHSGLGEALALKTALAGDPGGANKSEEAKWREEVLKQFDLVLSGGETVVDRLMERMGVVGDRVADRILEGLRSRAYDTASSAASAVAPFSPGGAAAGRLLDLLRGK